MIRSRGTGAIASWLEARVQEALDHITRGRVVEGTLRFQIGVRSAMFDRFEASDAIRFR